MTRRSATGIKAPRIKVRRVHHPWPAPRDSRKEPASPTKLLDIDKVFKALADPSRRHLLDLLHRENGQTLTALCECMDMTRQAVTQHLRQLEEANLVAIVWQGREKLHYLNAVPLHEIHERWIEKFERNAPRRLRSARCATSRRDWKVTTMTKPSFVYVTYIATTPEKVWQALVDTDVTRKYWADPTSDSPAHVNVWDWKTGSQWEHQRLDDARTVDMVGKVVESSPPRRLVITWARPKEAGENSKHSRVTFDIEPQGDGLVRLTVMHEDLERDPQMFESISKGWPKVLSNLKTLLETGRALPHSPLAA